MRGFARKTASHLIKSLLSALSMDATMQDRLAREARRMTGSADDNVLLAVSSRLASIDERLDRAASQIEANAEQIATLSENITRLENTVNTGFDHLQQGLIGLRQSLDQQHEITRMQGTHIDRLIALLEQRV